MPKYKMKFVEECFYEWTVEADNKDDARTKWVESDSDKWKLKDANIELHFIDELKDEADVIELKPKAE